MKNYKPLNSVALIGEIIDTPHKNDDKIEFTLKVENNIIDCYTTFMNEYKDLRETRVIGLKGVLRNTKVEITEYYQMIKRK